MRVVDNLCAPAREGAEENMKAAIRRSSLLFIFLLAVECSTKAQDKSLEAHLFGTLVDSSGAGVGEVQVTAQREGVAAASQLWKARIFERGKLQPKDSAGTVSGAIRARFFRNARLCS